MKGKKNHWGITFLIMFALTLVTSFIHPDVAEAGKIRKFVGKSKFGKPTLFSKGDKYVGVGYVNGWGGGLDFNGQYFVFDDISVQGHYSRMTYDYGWGEATANYMSGAAVYHYKFEKEFGVFVGLGFAVGKATWDSRYTGYSGDTSYDMGGLYYTSGLEYIHSKDIMATVGWGVTGLGLSANYKF